MASLVGDIERPKEGGDPDLLWRTVNEILDILENVEISIIPDVGGKSAVTKGQIRLDLSKFLTYEAAKNLIPNFGGESGDEPIPGGTHAGGDPSAGGASGSTN